MEEKEEGKVEEMVMMMMEGVASIAFLPCGSISGHFIQLPHSICYGLCGTELACERECSRGEDYRLINPQLQISIRRKNKSLLWSAMVMMLLGSTALIMLMVFDNHHKWMAGIFNLLFAITFERTGMIEPKDVKNRISVSFECETLKAEKAAEDHIRKFMPKLAELDAVVNIGKMTISGLDFGEEDRDETE